MGSIPDSGNTCFFNSALFGLWPGVRQNDINNIISSLPKGHELIEPLGLLEQLLKAVWYNDMKIPEHIKGEKPPEMPWVTATKKLFCHLGLTYGEQGDLADAIRKTYDLLKRAVDACSSKTELSDWYKPMDIKCEYEAGQDHVVTTGGGVGGEDIAISMRRDHVFGNAGPVMYTFSPPSRSKNFTETLEIVVNNVPIMYRLMWLAYHKEIGSGGHYISVSRTATDDLLLLRDGAIISELGGSVSDTHVVSEGFKPVMGCYVQVSRLNGLSPPSHTRKSATCRKTAPPEGAGENVPPRRHSHGRKVDNKQGIGRYENPFALLVEDHE